MEALTRLGFTRILDFELILASDPDKSRKITPKITWPIRHQSQNRLRLFHLFIFMTYHHKLFFVCHVFNHLAVYKSRLESRAILG